MKTYPAEVFGKDPDPYRILYYEYEDGLTPEDIYEYACAWKDESITFYEVDRMLSNPLSREGILMPPFWRAAPEHFVSELNDDINHIERQFEPAQTTAEKQKLVLEIILNIWIDHLYDPDYYVKIYQDQRG